MTEQTAEITGYLQRWRNGDESALEDVLPLVYKELRLIAKRYRAKERSEHTFQTTEIISEAYLRLAGQNSTDWQDRSHFFAVASTMMRNLLVDHARAKNYQKRGRGAEKLNIDDVAVYSKEPDSVVLKLDEALTELAKFDERKSRIVELRYFGGLSSQEVGKILGLSEITVKREWLKAKAWLYNELAA